MFKLAWRNIWRNRSRSLISIGAVAFSVFFAVIMRAFALGSYDNMIDTVMGKYFGYIQVHQSGYWDDQILENSLEVSPTLVDHLNAYPEVESVAGRLEAFSLVSSGDITKGGLVMGINPAAELEGFNLENRMIEGHFLVPGDHSVVVGKDLAKFLKVGLDDTLFFIGQGYQAQSAYGKYPIKGVVNMQNPELNKTLVLMPLEDAQWMFACGGRLTTLALKLAPGTDYNALTEILKQDKILTEAVLEVMTWEELFPDVIQGIKADSAGGLVFVFILYTIIGFVLLGTVIMMVAERRIEFGILVSVGMQKSLLSWVTVLENMLLAIIGGGLGVALSRPIMVYFNRNPIAFGAEMKAAFEDYGYEAIMPASVDWSISLSHGLIVTLIAIFVSLYAVVKIRSLKPVEAIRP